ncbi:D-alanyl-lipoteichoic acid biosynthesis protein DltD [Streptococcus equinus]|uniref:D-alanyl-lipoteichoic acid biosynthesis protein DltD n=1 Tax=Streptococcus equinus TaxID=1335 RepID=UPI003EEF997B
MLKRLWQILGPVICAVLMVVMLLACVPSSTHSHSLKAEKKDAVSLTKTGFKSKYKKVRALSDSKHRFVPFFGSSEWLRLDKMHPSVLAEAYHRNYTPYLLGQRGSASLTHYFGIQQIDKELKNKQVVYFISPQWFTAKGANAAAFQEFFSSGQAIDFLQHQTGSACDRYAAKRFLKLYPESSYQDLMKKVAAGKSLTKAELKKLSYKDMLFQKEDVLFSQLSIVDNYDETVKPQAKLLQENLTYPQLEKIATADGKKASSGNSFGIDNTFYNLRIKPQSKRLKNSQTRFNYLKSPEYNDLQLVLNQFAQNNTDVLFVIPPVNSKWSDYTGLNQDMYQKSVEKIKYQLKSQGFNHIADFSKDGDKAYFMQDTIHMGWNGWIAMDKAVKPFLDKGNTRPTYQINNRFLSKKWAKYTKNPSSFY